MQITNTEKKYRLYGIIGMIAVFLIGSFVGFIFNGSGVKHSVMSENQCRTIHLRIDDAIRYSNYDTFEKLSKLYESNCSNYDFSKQEQKKQEESKAEKSPKTTCEKIEYVLLAQLNCREEGTENCMDEQAHRDNAKIYNDLVKGGCQENSEKYKALLQQELQIADALKSENGNMSACAQIERVLRAELRCTDGYEICGNPDTHIENAKIYANLSERGCSENSGKYKELAKQELEIARALTDDRIEESPRESVEIVETYKRLQMQHEAERMIEKAKKLTNPAIDFIIQLEKIIEEN